VERVERVDQNYSKKRIGEGEVKLDLDLLAQSVLEEKKRKSGGGDDRSSKKQKSGLGTGSHEVTEEELGTFLLCAFVNYSSHIVTEAYRMNRRMTEDPMANYVDAEL
jgi:pre-mRNA-processing factor SLU7